MKKAALALLLALGLAGSAQAAPAKGCYSAEEARAENILRLHSELMVITVTCKQASTGRDLGAAYGKFTQNHIGPIKGAEGLLIQHYQKTRSGKGISHLDTLRTKLANEIGQKMADISAPLYCAQTRDVVVQLADSPLKEVGDYAQATYAGIGQLEPLCTKTSQAAVLKAPEKAKSEPTKKSG